MVLITGLCVVELYFFFMNFNKGAADIVLDDLEFKSVRMRRANFSRFALFKTTKNSHSFFIERKISFFAWYTLISHEWESYSKRPVIINVLPLNSKIFGGLLLRFFFYSVYIT